MNDTLEKAMDLVCRQDAEIARLRAELAARTAAFDSGLGFDEWWRNDGRSMPGSQSLQAMCIAEDAWRQGRCNLVRELRQSGAKALKHD